MAIGESRQFDHRDCPSGVDHRGRLSVLRKDHGLWLVYCYNCGDGNAIFLRDNVVRAEDVLSQLERHFVKVVEVVDDIVLTTKRNELPPDATDNPIEWDAWAHERCWNHNTRPSEMVRAPYFWKFSPARNQIIMPLHNVSGESTGYQARLAPAMKPKCITTYYEGHEGAPLYYRANQSNIVFIVEDPLSAARLHLEADMNVMALLGTHLSDTATVALIHLVNWQAIEDIHIWLDDDAAGKEASHKVYQRIAKLFSGNRRIKVKTHTYIEPKQIQLLREKVKEWILPS